MEQMEQKEIFLNGNCILIDVDNAAEYKNFEEAKEIAKNAGKRLLTEDEFNALCEFKNWWDPKRKGRWFQCPTPDGGTVDVFFPAAGARAFGSGSVVNPSTNGYCWSASPYSSTEIRASWLYFNSSYVFVHYYSYRADGLSVRCVRDIDME